MAQDIHKRIRQKYEQRERRKRKPWLNWYTQPDWQKYRSEFLEVNPFCVLCGDDATIVDHIEPHRGDRALFVDSKNHQALCKSCHDSKTARRDGGGGRSRRSGPDFTGDTGPDGFPLDKDHPWNQNRD